MAFLRSAAAHEAAAALYAGPRVTAVVLSGTLDDAALGSRRGRR
jgi:hypothetical protein